MSGELEEAREQGRAAGFPMADPMPPANMVTAPCGCTSMDLGADRPLVQVSWCEEHQQPYEPGQSI